MSEIEIGTVFPPRDEWDVAAYPTDDVVEGYRDHCISDPAPGENRSPGYRWGWANARKDASCQWDGFEDIRFAYIRMVRAAAWPVPYPPPISLITSPSRWRHSTALSSA